MVAENLESLSEEELGDRIEHTESLIKNSCGAGYSVICHEYRQKIIGYWNEQHRRHNE